MAYSNDSKPTGSFTNDTKVTTPTYGIPAGQPIAAGFFLFLTYISNAGFLLDAEPAAGNYSLDTKPS